MKRIPIAFGFLFLAAAFYFFSFASAYVQQITPGSSESQLVVFGMKFPYTRTTGRIFYNIYSPLFNHYAAKHPDESLLGTVREIDLLKSELLISHGNKSELLLIHIPPSMTSSARAFSQGDIVSVSYGMRPMQDNPIVSQYELRAISASYPTK